MYSDEDRTWFTYCEVCNSELLFNQITPIRVLNDHFNRRTVKFVCPHCNTLTESLVTGNLL